jgi:RNA polymerase sigma factor (sigma-70 family)
MDAMKKRQRPALLDQLHSSFLPQTTALSDSELLTRFLDEKDADAFTTLMQRHSRTVWGVCRHVLRHDHDAEDAFQATFLVLARKAGSIRKCTSLGSWLHGTAYHIASRARRDAAVRRTHEQKGKARPQTETGAETAWRELSALLDEELQGLPEKQRMAFVLCVLEGKSLAEAARQLGWKEGTLSGTLSRAREQLRWRLARRGVSLSAILTGLALCGQSAAPAALVEQTLTAIASVAREASRSFFVTKLHVGALLLLSAAIAAGVGGWASQKPETKEQPALADAVPSRAEAAPKTRTDRLGDPLPSGALARLGTVRFRERDAIFALAYSPNGKMLASATGYQESIVRVWDTATGKQLFLLRHDSGQIHSLAFSPDSKRLASLGARRVTGSAALHLWDAATGKEIRAFPHAEASGRTVAFSADGRRLFAGGAGNPVRLWDIASGKEVLQFKAPKTESWSFALSADGKRLATVNHDNTISLWDAAKGTELRRLTKPKQFLKSYSGYAAFSPDGKRVASGDPEGSVSLWDADSGRQRLTIPGRGRWRKARGFSQEGPSIVAFSPDGKYLAAGNEGIVYDTASGKERCQLERYPRWVRALVFSPDGKTLAGESSHRIRFWDGASGKEIFKDAAHRDCVCSLVFSADGKSLYTASRDDSARMWETATGREQFRFHGRREAEEMHPNKVARSPDGKTAVAWLAGVLYSWDTRKLEPKEEFSDAAGFDYRHGLAFSTQGRLLATAWSYKSKQIRLWTQGMAKEARLLDGQTNCGNGFALSPNGKLLACAGSDGRAELWDIDTAKPLPPLAGFTRHRKRRDAAYVAVFSLAFSPDSKTLALGSSDGSLIVWDVTHSKELHYFLGSENWVEALAFAPDGRTLAAGHADGVVRFWELASGKVRREWQTQSGGILALAFSADGGLFASAGSDTTALIWPADERIKPRDWTAKELEALWSDLAGEDAVKAYRAIGALRAVPQQSVPFLKARLPPVAEVDAKELMRWIVELDDERFAVREQATAELTKLGDRAEPALRQTLSRQPSLEVRRRIEAILAELDRPLSAEQFRQGRAVEVLERIATVPARQLLRRLAQGAAGARLTREAKAALRRIGG